MKRETKRWIAKAWLWLVGIAVACAFAFALWNAPAETSVVFCIVAACTATLAAALYLA